LTFALGQEQEPMKIMRKILFYLFAILFLAITLATVSFYQKDKPIEELKAKYAKYPSRFIRIDGMDVHYRMEGRGKDLLLIHGMAASLHTWDGWTKELKNHFRVIRLDMPGFGLTGPNPTRDYSLQKDTEFLRHFVQKLGLKKIHIAGNSLGGGIAWQYTLLYPESVDKLILVDSIGFPIETKVFTLHLAKNPLVKYIYPHFSSRHLITRSLHQVYHQDHKISEDLIDRYYDLSLRPGNRSALIDRMSHLRRYDPSSYSGINSETLILWGRQDRWIPVEHAYKFQRALKKSRLIIYPDAGHVPMEEIPEQSVKDVLDFLK